MHARHAAQMTEASVEGILASRLSVSTVRCAHGVVCTVDLLLFSINGIIRDCSHLINQLTGSAFCLSACPCVCGRDVSMTIVQLFASTLLDGTRPSSKSRSGRFFTFFKNILIFLLESQVRGLKLRKEKSDKRGCKSYVHVIKLRQSRRRRGVIRNNTF